LTSEPRSVVVIRSTTIVIAGGSNGELFRWNFQSSTLETFQGVHTGRVTSIVSVPNTNYIITGSYDKLIKKLDYTNLPTVLATYQSHTSVVSSITLITSLSLGISVGNDKIIRIWDYNTFVDQQRIPASTSAHSLNINGA
jgi:WD40 repeat protein